MTSYPPGMCPLVMYRTILQMSINQSCGKCIPCRDGLVEAERILKKIIEGDAEIGALDELKKLCEMISETADCAVGVVAANTVLDSLREFPDEYESHIKNKRCVENVNQTVPCITLCPAHVDVPAYVALINKGDYAGAINIIRDRNPLPTACAMVCEHPCERKCRRSIIDHPINIRGLKKFAVDQITADQVKTPAPNVATGKKIAIVGGGPSGLTAAYFLSLMGHTVEIFDEHEKLGGMLRYGIPEYRLPKARLDEDITAILNAGDITVHTGTKIGRDVTVEELDEKFDAIYLGLGAQLGNRIPVKNADCENVVPAADFLQAVARGDAPDFKGKTIALIGGGNVAMDAARTAVRLGADSVNVFTRKRDDYTALDTEIESAMQEGIRFTTLLSFLHLEADKDNPGKISAVWLQPEIVGEYDWSGFVKTEHSVTKYPYRFKCDYLIIGVGQRCDVEVFDKAGIPTERGRILADTACMIEGKEKFFSGEEFDQHELAKGLRIGVRSGDIRPVYCGSAELQTGIERLLDLITEYFPSYAEKGHVHALNAKGETIDMETNENEALSAFVFKTIIDPFVGKISYLKVMSGVLNSDSQVCNAQKDITEKVAQVYVVNGKYQLGVGKLFTGDIGCVVKLSQTQTNDTLCTLSKVVHYPPIDFPKPMLGYAIWPKTKADEDKMSVGIRNMCEEDHTIRLDKNAETHEQVLYGMGDQHIDLILSKLKSKYKVDVTTSVPTVQYRETIRGKAEAQGKYKKQNGGAGQYGDVWVRFEPCDSEEMVFAEEVFGGAVPKQYFPPTEQGLRDCMQHGPLAGFKVVGVKATLYDGSYHPVDSKEVAFKEAARLAYNAAMPKADPVLLEPICKVTTIAPEEYTGTLMGDFTKRRGLILDMQMNEDGDQVISAEVPMAEMLTYANELRSMTQGRGTYTLEFDRYQAAPKEVAEKVIAAQKAKNQK